MYEKTIEVVGPEADKLKAFYRFQKGAIAQFCNQIRSLAHPERLKGFISHTTKITLGKMLGMFAVLDRLKV